MLHPSDLQHRTAQRECTASGMPANAGAARRSCGTAGGPWRQRRGPRQQPCTRLGAFFRRRACGSWLWSELRGRRTMHALGCRRAMDSGRLRGPVTPNGCSALHLRMSAVQAYTCLMLSARGGKSLPRGGLHVRATHLPKVERRQAELIPCWLCRHSGAFSLSSLGCALLHRRGICACLRVPFPGCCTF